MSRTKQTARSIQTQILRGPMRRYPHYLSGGLLAGVNLGDTPLDMMGTGEKIVGFGGAAASLIALGSLAAHSRSTTLATAGIASAFGIASLVIAGLGIIGTHAAIDANSIPGANSANASALGNLSFGAGTLLASTIALLGARGS